MTDLSGLRVVLGLESSGPGGAERVVLVLAEALRSAGADASILTLRPGWMTERAEALGIPHRVLPQRRGLDVAWILRNDRGLTWAARPPDNANPLARQLFFN